jgi:hypothetical protein
VTSGDLSSFFFYVLPGISLDDVTNVFFGHTKTSSKLGGFYAANCFMADCQNICLGEVVAGVPNAFIRTPVVVVLSATRASEAVFGESMSGDETPPGHQQAAKHYRVSW